MQTANEQNVQFAVPSAGFIFGEDVNQYVLCKPMLMPLKSIPLEKQESMQKDAENKMKMDIILKQQQERNQQT